MKIKPEHMVQIVNCWGEIPIGTRTIYKNRQWIVAPLSISEAEDVPEGHIPLIDVLPSTPVSDLDAALKTKDLKKISFAASRVHAEYRSILLRFLNLGSKRAVVIASLSEIWTQYGGNDQTHSDFSALRKEKTGMEYVGC